jgi:hypothetical protein
MELKAKVNYIIQDEIKKVVQLVVLDKEQKPLITLVASFTNEEDFSNFKFGKNYDFVINQSE